MENTIQWLESVVVTTPPIFAPQLHTASTSLCIHTTLHDRVQAIKNEIDHIAPAGTWDDAKKITNPYEYIFLSLQRRMHRSIAATIPLSRSYFKMIEIWEQAGLDPATVTASAHTAEGPGGFLEAIQARVPRAIPMIAMTLRSTEHTIPGWRKSQAFLARYPTITVTYGADNTGNLYSLANQDAYAAAARTHLGTDGASVYTADGGFDFSADFNGQEQTVQRLLIAEALAGVSVLRPGGTMILKLFDTKCRATLELLWMLAACFEQTGQMKPYTSRPANSERYWIGKGFRGAPAWVMAALRHLTATPAPHGWSQLFAEPPWHASWLGPIQTFQESIEVQQFHTIELTLNLIQSATRARIRELLLENIRKSRQWCQRYRVPLNPRYTTMSDDAIVTLNLEEVLVPFRVEAAQTSSPGPSRHEPMHRASSYAPLQPPPAAPAWRSAIPASVLGRGPSQRGAEMPPSGSPAPSQSGLH